jgi:hypothetical protein
MSTLTGACHCGNLAYALEWPDGEELQLRRCACAFCTKHGGLYTSHPRAALAATVQDGRALSRYTFGTRTAEVFVCTRCGVAPWIASVIDGQTFAVVNANTFDPPPRGDGVPLRTHDSEPLADRLARRRRHWIPTVAITVAEE